MESSFFWQDFANFTVERLVQPKKGETFLIITDTENDLNLAQACLIAGERAGAISQLIVKPRHRGGGQALGGLSPVISQAILESRLVLEFCGGIVRAPAMLEARTKKGARLLSTYLKGIENYALRATLDVDFDAMVRDANRLASIYAKTKICRVTSAHGTDVSFQLAPRRAIIGDGALTEDGEVDFFPGAQVSIAPVEETINGVIVVDCSDSYNGVIKNPYSLIMKNGVVTEIKGGIEAEITKNVLKSRNDEKVYRLCHFSVGHNPKARIVGQALEDERVVAAIDFGFGFQDPDFGGTIGYSPFHWDIMMATPSIFCDGVHVSGNGQFNHELGFEILNASPGWNY
jgi:2,5-dihydroxypyridine 5,6-dioxygenase